ncbi:MAG: threonine--tRNA ligase, partial [Campylobacterota bacterium]
MIDLQTAKESGFEGEQILLDNSEESLNILRHSTAHLMAQAIKSLYPDAKFFVGPNVKEGFYYDFKTSREIGEADLKEIEKEMLSIAKKKYPIEKYEITMDEAKEK